MSQADRSSQPCLVATTTLPSAMSTLAKTDSEQRQIEDVEKDIGSITSGEVKRT